jgi:mannose-6-phosphate isomerase-like protein (cupin superfamily)
MNYYRGISSTDYGPLSFATNVEHETKRNQNFRTALWTGSNLQMTVMCIPVYGEIGIEVHHNTDHILSVKEGQGLVKIGNYVDRLDFQQHLSAGDTIFIPAGVWHNIINAGKSPLRLSSVYAPPAHPRGTVHRTKEEEREGY